MTEGAVSSPVVVVVEPAGKGRQTLQNKWAYGAIYGSSAERTAALPGWLWHYNFRRRHGSLGKRPPAARLAELEQRGE